MALNAFLKLAGTKAGAIQGSSTQKGREGKIVVIAVNHEIVTPRDVATGQATGKRQHHPLVITKELDRASVPLRQMLLSNDSCKEWELQFWSPSSKTGVETQTMEIRLFNAAIVSIELQMPNNKRADSAGLETFEEVSFAYQKIEWTWVDGGIVASDDMGKI